MEEIGDIGNSAKAAISARKAIRAQASEDLAKEITDTVRKAADTIRQIKEISDDQAKLDVIT